MQVSSSYLSAPGWGNCLLTIHVRYAVSKEEVAAKARCKANAGGFNNSLGRLRTLELVQGRGEIRASDNLFELERRFVS
jgi:hypothetical protein